MDKTLAVVCPQGDLSEAPRLRVLLEEALDGVDCQWFGDMKALPALQNRRILFVLPLGESGVTESFAALLRRLRLDGTCLEGCLGGIVAEGQSELYTKSSARALAFAANRAGCAFVGRPLVEATGSLANFQVLARVGGTDLLTAYRDAVFTLVRELLDWEAPSFPGSPRILALHASNHESSNTWALWDLAKTHLEGCEITEIGLRNGAVVDCSGCPYSMCLHFGERGECFYGGVMVEGVFPAILRCNALVLLCPNYNDALSANLTAFINRLTALYRQTRFYRKSLYALVVSGYSGGDIVASQLIGALNMNKSFFLPARFCMLETANDPGSVMRLDGIGNRVRSFARNILTAGGPPPDPESGGL
jgi:multimeric flavodoxin WrbA